jgi:hypothetical protein
MVLITLSEEVRPMSWRAWQRPRRGGRVFLIPAVGDGQFLALLHTVLGRGDILTLPAACLERHQSPTAAAGRLARALLGVRTAPQLVAVLPRTTTRGSAYVYAVPVTLPRPSSGSRWQLVTTAEAELAGIDLRPRDLIVYLSADSWTLTPPPEGTRRYVRHRTPVFTAALRAAATVARAINAAAADHA